MDTISLEKRKTMVMMSETLKNFLMDRENFDLKSLDTEKLHPRYREKTIEELSSTSFLLSSMKSIDSDCIEEISKLILDTDLIYQLKRHLEETFLRGGRVFLCGYGSSGRMGLLLEFLWRNIMAKGEASEELLVSFMGGLDQGAFSVFSNLEDSEEEGAKDLKEKGFRKGDLVIGLSEGGETNYVIGALKEAVKESYEEDYHCHHFFLFCNKESVLYTTAPRLKEILTMDRVVRIPLFVGPMSIMGSTRLQASTALLTYLVFVFRHLYLSEEEFSLFIKNEINKLKEGINILGKNLGPLVECLIQKAKSHKGLVFNLTGSSEDLQVMTILDVFEQVATFHLSPPFNKNIPIKRPFNVSLSLKGEKSLGKKLESLMKRKASFPSKDYEEKFYSYEMSHQSYAENFVSFLFLEKGNIEVSVGKDRFEFHLPTQMNPSTKQIFLKIFFNTIFSAVWANVTCMAGNFTTSIRPLNFKLTDRIIRIVRMMRPKLKLTDEEMAKRIFSFYEEKYLKEKDLFEKENFVDSFLKNSTFS